MTDPLAETQLQEPPDPLLDTLVGEKYRVHRRIGKGGFGAVYEVRHAELNKRFAMKVLLPELSERADVVRRFRNEALAASSIGNEHIVEVIDIGLLPSKAHYLLLEFLEGEDFAHLIERDGPLSLGRTARIMTQICEGLAAAHQKNIVHRDLKPENIFLLKRKKEQDFVKILDFGISKFSEGGGAISGFETETSAILGTPYFMSPEQLNSSKNVDARADMYALGVILYRALTCEFPFSGVSFGGIVVAVMTQPIPDVRVLRPDLPEEITKILNRLLAKSRDERTANCETLIAELEPFLSMDEPASVVNSRAPVAFDATLTPSLTGKSPQVGGVEHSTLPANRGESAHVASDVAPVMQLAQVAQTEDKISSPPPSALRPALLGAGALALVLAAGSLIAKLASAPTNAVSPQGQTSPLDIVDAAESLEVDASLGVRNLTTTVELDVPSPLSTQLAVVQDAGASQHSSRNRRGDVQTIVSHTNNPAVTPAVATAGHATPGTTPTTPTTTGATAVHNAVPDRPTPPAAHSGQIIDPEDPGASQIGAHK